MATLFIVQLDATEPDPYTVLGVERTATAAEIRGAYRTLVTLYHPDRHQGNPLAALAGEKLTEINRAYRALSTLRVFEEGAARPAPASSAGPKRPPRPAFPWTSRPVSRATRAYQATTEAELTGATRTPARRYGPAVMLVALLPLVVRFGDATARTIRSFVVELLGGLTLVEDSTVAAVLATLVLTLVVLLRVRRGAASKHDQPFA